MDQNIAGAAGMRASSIASGATMRRNSDTERARESRRRKKDGLRLIPIEIFEQEIDDLVRLGQLPASERADRISVSHVACTLSNNRGWLRCG